jgi:alpha-L-arabinofuranosidase
MVMRDVKFKWLVMAGLLALRPADGAPKPPSVPIQISVDAAEPRWPISRYLTGMHFVYGFERDSLYRNERIVEWMRRAKVGTIRWPGGTVVQAYHWDRLNGISFGTDSWEPGYDRQPAPSTDFMDLDEYVAFCRRIGAEPMVGVNLGSGRKFNRLEDSLDEARRLIRYCVDKDYRVRHWYIGNECYIGWGAAGYAKMIDLYGGVLRSVDPDIVIIGDWKFGPERKKRFEEALLIAKSSKQIDVMEIHEKWGTPWGLSENGGDPSLENWQTQSGLYGGRLDAYAEKFLAEMKSAGKDVQLAFNEWGAAMAGDSGPFHVALVKADYLVTLFRQQVYSACDWNLNMGPGKSKILNTKNDGHDLTGLSPAALVFEMCASAQEKQNLLAASSDPLVYGFAAKDPETGAVQIYLLNKYSNPVSVKLSVRGLPWTEADCSVTSFVEPGVVKEAGAHLKSVNQSAPLRLAPLSFNRITLGPASQVE